MEDSKRFDIKRTTTNTMINNLLKGSEATIDVFGVHKTYILLSKKRDRNSGKMIYTFVNIKNGREIEYTNGLLNFTILAVSNSNIGTNRKLISQYKFKKAKTKILGNVVAVKINENGDISEKKFFEDELPSEDLSYLNRLLVCCDCHHGIIDCVAHIQNSHDGWEWYYLNDFKRKWGDYK